MPRARIPNASFIASAEFPILPFLAPRVFAESCILRRYDRNHGEKYQPQEEKKTAARDEPGMRGVAAEPATAKRPWVDTQCTLSWHENQGPASGRLYTARQRHRPLGGTLLKTPVQLCYSGISNFARQHIRGYRTVEPTVRKIAIQRKRPVQRTRRAAVPHKPSVLHRRGRMLAARREVAMATERERLANHLSHEPERNVRTLLKQGKYRSLRRRITNLHFWDTTVLDLRQRRGGSTKPLNLIRAFAALDRSLYPSVRRLTRKIAIRHDHRCAKWSVKLFEGTAKHEVHQAWKNWLQFDVETRKMACQRLLIYLLHRKPGRAMQFIYILANDPLLRGRKTEAIADALGHLSKIHRNGNYGVNEGWSHNTAAVKQSFVPAFVHVYQKALVGLRDVCSQDLLYNLVDLADVKGLKKVFDCLLEHRAYLGFDTVLHYTNAFANAGDFTYALRCLEQLRRMNNSGVWDVVSGRQRLRWTCALILRKSIAKGQDYHNTPGIVAAIVRLGIEMDTLLYNVVMHNAMDAGDYSTAFKVYNTLEANGLKADKHTYSILLHGCASQSNPAMFSKFAQHCADVAKETEDPWLATDYLHYLYVRHQNDSDKAKTLDLLQQQYLRFFSPRPLELINGQISKFSSWISRSSGFGRQETSAGSDKQANSAYALDLEAPPVALYIILQAQIQAALARSSQQLLDLYQRFATLAKQDSNPELLKLASNPIIWNAFLLAFCSKQQFASASQLIKDMTEGSPQPNIYSWNIFMQAFFKTSQVQAAERVFEILRSRGINPDGFTYGVLLRGYARAQHVERIGETMQYVDSEQEMEPDLLRMLAKILNRNKLMLTLEKSRIVKEVQAAERARKVAEEEEERWREPQLIDDELEIAIPSLANFTSEEMGREEAIKEALPEGPAPESEEQEDFLGQPIEPEPEPQIETQQPVPLLPTPPKLSSFDPEFHYRKLQEELGILSPAIQPQSKPVPTNPFGATLGFKFMLPSDPAMPTITKVPKGSISGKGESRIERRRRSKYR